VRFLLDQHVSPLVAARLRSLGHDAVAVVERQGLRGAADEQLRQVASTEDRVLVTYDVRDFGRMGMRMARTAEPHPGMVLVAPRAFSPGANDVGRLSDALHALATSDPGRSMADRIVWLRPTPE
jgi:hypothetical protein